MECSMGKNFSVTIKMLLPTTKSILGQKHSKPILKMNRARLLGFRGIQNIDEEKLGPSIEKSMAVIESQNARLSHFAQHRIPPLKIACGQS